MKTLALFASLAASAGVAWLSWQVIPLHNSASVQPIASTAASISGVLFGFVLASTTILLSASGNTLVENTKKTLYFPKLIARLSKSMALLLLVCIVFLGALFIPSDLGLFDGKTLPTLLSMVMVVGVFLFSFSVCVFISVWYEFSKFARLL